MHGTSVRLVEAHCNLYVQQEVSNKSRPHMGSFFALSGEFPSSLCEIFLLPFGYFFGDFSSPMSLS